ncbi:MAG: class II fructose-bisphosphate aldolase [bacterium]|nr:class II fructose-bisphosphate aldolase [bacterium]
MKLKELLTRAQNEGFAIGAFNASDLVTIRAIAQAAKNLNAPVIIETSPGETDFLGLKNLSCLIRNYQKEGNLIFANLDHAESEEIIEEAVESGFNMVHFDGSKMELEENIAQSLQVVGLAHQKGILVEGEIDHIEGHSQKNLQTAESLQKTSGYTNPEKAVVFVKETGVDILAVAIGNLHGVFQTEEKIDLERLRNIRENLSCFFSLHGSSGIVEEEIRKAIQIGKIVKINVNTDLRLAYRRALDAVIGESEEVVPYKLFAPVVEAVQKVVEEKIRLFGSEGKVK